jgi:hypothetical protein
VRGEEISALEEIWNNPKLIFAKHVDLGPLYKGEVGVSPGRHCHSTLSLTVIP